MSRPRVIEVDYYDFMRQLKSAIDARNAIEKSDKEKWKAYISENNIRDVSLEAHAKVKFTGKPKLAAIVGGSDWDGCYAYSIDDEAVIKYVIS